MKTVTNTVCILGAIVAAWPALAQQPPDGGARPAPAASRAASPQRPRETQRRGVMRRENPSGVWTTSAFTRTLPIGTRNTFELNNVVGSIVITGAPGSSEVRIAATRKTMMANKDAANAVLQRVVHTITQRGGGVEVLTSLPDGVKEPIFVDYEIMLPASAAVSVRSWGGGLRVSNVGGEIRAELNGGGDIAIMNARRIGQAKALLGNVSVVGMDGDELNAETIGGTLQVRNITAQTIELRSIHGAIVVNNATCDRCTMSSVSGNIDISGPLRLDSRLTVNSNTGNIRLAPTGAVRFNLEALTTGVKQSDYPLVNKRSNEPRTILRGVYGEDEGSTIISLRSFSGNIHVARP
jgi:hypothetical protein